MTHSFEIHLLGSLDWGLIDLCEYLEQKQALLVRIGHRTFVALRFVELSNYITGAHETTSQSWKTLRLAPCRCFGAELYGGINVVIPLLLQDYKLYTW